MESDNGSPELPPNWPGPIVLPPDVAAQRSGYGLTPEEQDRIADGEPYCFRCGKPASSFSEYDYQFAGGDRADYVRNQEGTYNPETNRFACDACYIAIGMPAGPGGWRAP